MTATTGFTMLAATDLQDAKATAAQQERDPVCGMTVDTVKAKAANRTSVYEGKTFYFCNDSCKKQFDAEPAKFAQKKTDETTSAMGGGCCCHGRMGQPANGGSGMNGGGMCGRRMK